MDGNLREQNFDALIGMFAQAPIGLCCFDRTLRYIFINDYLATLNGISVEEHLGRSIRDAGLRTWRRAWRGSSAKYSKRENQSSGEQSMRKPRPIRDA